METPYEGRAIFQDNFDSVIITIPSKKDWLMVFFMCFWIGGSFLVLSGDFFKGGFSKNSNFEILWISGYSIGGLFVLSTLVWNLIGKEIITIVPGVITIQRMGSPFFKTKSYDLNNAGKLVADQVYDPYNTRANRNIIDFISAKNGTIKFEYGMQTIRFADKLDEAEANYLLEKLRAKKLIK